ncbi:hypothetical protein D918_09404 [Trichuris suis]|nr:hypothetical protein D918_09404 [Trichuris suis]
MSPVGRGPASLASAPRSTGIREAHRWNFLRPKSVSNMFTWISWACSRSQKHSGRSFFKVARGVAPRGEFGQDSSTHVLENWIAKFRVPARMTTDQGRQFNSELWSTFSKFLGCQHISTSSSHPQANGLVERLH